MALTPEAELQAKLLLQGILLFSGAPSDQIAALLRELEMLEVKKGKVLLMDQEISKTLFILAKGSVGIWRRQGGEKQLVATLRSPDFFGETSMFSESAATALVKTEEDSRLFTLKKSSFDAVQAKFPTLGPLVQKHIEEIKAARPPLVKPTTTSEEA